MSRSLIWNRLGLLTVPSLLAAALVFAGCHRTSNQAGDASQSNAQTAGTSGPGGNAANQGPGGNGPNGYQGPGGAPGQPQGPVMVPITVDSGTMVGVRIDQSVSTRTANDGDPFSGELYEPLLSANGAVVFPPGTPVSGVVVATKNRGRFKGAGYLALRLQQIGNQQVRTDDFEISAKGKGKRTAGFIGGGAGGGALIGALAGGGTGALIGGLIGGGAGTAGAAFTDNKPLVIPAEARLRFRLTAPLTVSVPQ